MIRVYVRSGEVWDWKPNVSTRGVGRLEEDCFISYEIENLVSQLET